MRTLIACTVAVILFLFASGCGKTVATVNGQAITQKELDQELEKISGKRMLESLIDKKLVEQDAGSRKVSVSEEEINRRLEEAKKTLTPLDKKSLGDDQIRNLKEEIRTNLLIQKAIISRIPETEVKSYHEKNKDILPQVELSVIVAGDAKQATAIVEELQRGKEFASMARQFSLDPIGRERGGYVGYVPRGNLQQLSPELAQTAFSLKVGQVSPVIKTPKGYYVLKVLNKRQTFDELRDEIERLMAGDRVKGYLEELREKAKIDYKGEYAKQ